MKLYYKPGACSLASHIVLRESGLPFDIAKVDLATKKLDDGSDFLAISPKGQVPALVTGDGGLLTEGAVIMQYVADQAPEKLTMPPSGSPGRYPILEWLNFVATELHKGFSPLFRPTTPDAYKDIVKATLKSKFELLNKRLGDSPYLACEAFTVADAYAFTTLRWAAPMGLDLSVYPNVTAYMQRIAERPAVQAALAAEGLA